LVTLNPTLLKAGLLERAEAGAPQAQVGLLRIRDPQVFKQHMLSGWNQALTHLLG
jgi:hypothetical protein